MKNNTHPSNSTAIQKMAELVALRKKQEAEKEENRKRVMSKQLRSVIGDNRIVITHNSK